VICVALGLQAWVSLLTSEVTMVCLQTMDFSFSGNASFLGVYVIALCMHLIVENSFHLTEHDNSCNLLNT